MPKVDLTPNEINMIDKMIVNNKTALYKEQSETDNEEHRRVINLRIKSLVRLQVKLGTFV